MNELYPLLFEPNLKEVIWGGHRIEAWKHLPPDNRPIGESWEVSSIPGHESIISNGAYKGQDLNTVTHALGERLLGQRVKKEYGEELPLLVKFIDAAKDLSIQVHPDDQMARRHHLQRGKTEMWYILDADEGASVLAGFNRMITPREYAERVRNNTITDVLARHFVRPGDVLYIPAGRVHAICAGIRLVEVQQSSDITYRIYDYNRPGLDGKPRPLHTALAAEAIHYEVLPNYLTSYTRRKNTASPVIRSPYFDLNVLELTRPLHRNVMSQDSFVICICLRGNCRIITHAWTSGNGLDAHEGDATSKSDGIILNEANSALIPREIADYEIIPLTQEVKLLETYISR